RRRGGRICATGPGGNRGVGVPPVGRPGPHSETLRGVCKRGSEVPGEDWGSGKEAKACSMRERTLNRQFQQQTSLTWSEWVRRAKLMEALVRLAQGPSVLRGALGLGSRSPRPLRAMFRLVIGLAPPHAFPPPAAAPRPPPPPSP
ncbi:AraC family transcriptional regulator, partial [Staphylococcus aureus]|nr:AraC family transcriptional regulator [Staphylococcus aureus]